MAKLRVGIIDSGIDLQKLYHGERHGYEAVWVPVEGLSFAALSGCDLVIVPTGTDNTWLSAKSDCLRHFLNRGGWVYCFDGRRTGCSRAADGPTRPRTTRRIAFGRFAANSPSCSTAY